VFTAVLACAAASSAACRARADQKAEPAERTVVWRPLGSWSGNGSLQTESFTSDTGTLRVTWEAAPKPPAAAKTPVFRLTAHSAISGRPLQQVADEPGGGTWIGYVQQDPHVFYMVVDAPGLAWKFTVEEAVEYR
jgi:hypothetical protein